VRCEECENPAEYLVIEDSKLIPLCRDHLEDYREMFGEMAIDYITLPQRLADSFVLAHLVRRINERFKW